MPIGASEAATGGAGLAKLVRPVRGGTRKRLMELGSSVSTMARVACGVAQQTGERAGGKLWAVVTGVALVAAAFGGASAVKAVASKVIGGMAGQLTKL
ncbi:hypothetical protein CF641_38555, partial [Burkholderia pseudomallei]